MSLSREDVTSSISDKAADSTSDRIASAVASDHVDKPSVGDEAATDERASSAASAQSKSEAALADEVDKLDLGPTETEGGKTDITSSDTVTEPVTKPKAETTGEHEDRDAEEAEAGKVETSTDVTAQQDDAEKAIGTTDETEPPKLGSTSEAPTSALLGDAKQEESTALTQAHHATIASHDQVTDQPTNVAPQSSEQPTPLKSPPQPEESASSPPPILPSKDDPPRTPDKAPETRPALFARNIASPDRPSTPASQSQTRRSREVLAGPQDVAAVAHAFGRDSPALRTSSDTPQRVSTPSKNPDTAVTKGEVGSSSDDVEKQAIRDEAKTQDAAGSSTETRDNAAAINEKGAVDEQSKATPRGGISIGNGPPPTTQASEERPFDFNRFLEQMKHRSAQPVGEYVRSFIKGFSKKPYRTQDQVKLIFDFLDFIAARMQECDIWKNLGDTDFENAKEAMEKLVMNRLYPYTFTPAVQKEGRWAVQTDDLERDRVLRQRIGLFGWLSEEHLDVPVGDHSRGFIEFSIQELLKINHYKAPRDKLICILNACKVIFGMIRHLSTQESADNFIPVLIFVVLKANPEHLISNVEYISRFRNPDRLSSESGYYLSSLQGAIAFIETMDYTSLSSITQEEFEKKVEEAMASLPEPEPSAAAAAASGSAASEASFLARPTTPPPKEAQPSFGYPKYQRSVSGASVSAPSGPGEEAAKPLPFTPVAASLADDTRAFFLRTGEAARTGLSRPMGALGRLINEGIEGIRTPSNNDSGASTERQNSPAPPASPGSSTITASTSRPKLFGGLFGSLDAPKNATQGRAAGYPGQQGGRRSMPFLGDDPQTPPTDDRMQDGFHPYASGPAGGAPDVPSRLSRPKPRPTDYSIDDVAYDDEAAGRRHLMATSRGSDQSQRDADYYNDEADDDDDDDVDRSRMFSNSATAEQHRQRRQMQQDIGHGFDDNFAGTPSRRAGDEQGRLQAGRREEIAYEHAQTEQAIHRSLMDQEAQNAVQVDEAAQNSASVETLKSIFPTVDDSVIQMVLQGCEGNVETAIDRLLEMH
ncbi:Ubiquitin system component Cue [Kalmanozyma brasiliensis GHG001]|uniref:Ubiquitin system component Cue n=1 Tax=Kalmanozyma brasiliensis (strain GHG001) TaxID=1365824 RepID=UPI002867E6BA|nr:Ubiquitin system component Cue [Kalmanozyma brasiliensis GHG001]KAF6767225.1 Ubiquitin system component Cue [Kalmanozyma brasiliensis GHG001]